MSDRFFLWILQGVLRGAKDKVILVFREGGGVIENLVYGQHLRSPHVYTSGKTYMHVLFQNAKEAQRRVHNLRKCPHTPPPPLLSAREACPRQC